MSCNSCNTFYSSAPRNRLGLGDAFSQREAIRISYNAMADYLRDELLPMLTGSIRTVVKLYLARTRAVMARGAIEADKQEIIRKIAEWEAVLLEQARLEQAAVSRVVAEAQADALIEEARIIQASDAQARIASAKAVAAATVERAASEAVAAATAASSTLPTGAAAPYEQPIMASLTDNPLLLVAAAGALIFLLMRK